MEKVKLGQLTNIKTGRLDVNAENPNGKYPFFTCSKNHTYIDEYAFDGESVLVAGNGDLNVKYYNGKFNAYQRTYVIQANENLNGKFLYYFLDSYVEKLREQSIGGVIKYIKLGNLTDAEIPLPSLATQQRIAAILIFTKTNAGGTEKVWFYDMKADGLSLDDKRQPVKENDIPEIIARYHQRKLTSEIERSRTEQSFVVSKTEIAENDYDLSINRYKEVVYEEVQYEKPSTLIQDIKALQRDNAKKLLDLEKMLG